MKHLLLILSFFMATHSFAQVELLGKYVTSFIGIGSESITFVGKDSFYFEGGYCGEMVRGRGRCEIRDNFLYLFFGKADTNDDPAKLPVIKTSSNNDNVVDLTITCVNEKARALDYVSVQIIRSNGMKTALFTDSLGKTGWKFNGADLPLQITVSAVGYETRHLRIDSLLDHNITLALKEYSGTKVVKGEVWFYEIEELSEDVIMMKPAKSTEDYRRYTKK